ncbi:PWWP domain-containing protein 2A-like [Thrips palmi]|uniref:PWWP domain-containing protein 2A-like n=1 Tax=Thrips palmi TaxID=161013 RepID=A0A6P8ZJC6_THRPL|nr:PWWP domain-containing protein 2A-like [Thrips palmi]
MADLQPLQELSCLKSTDILVHVEEALLDFLVVSYEHDSKLYQGVLLDSTKRSLPCGILTPPGFPVVDSAQHGLGSDEDKMYSVAQRYSYFQEKCPSPVNVAAKDSFPPGSAYHMRRAMRGGHSKFKNSRMTVRLRPRQVLCSKCKSTCNENSENVDLSRKRKSAESTASNKGPVEKKVCPPRQISPKSPRPPFSENPQENKPSLASRRKNSSSPPVDSPSLRQSLIPKTVMESEIPQTLSSNVNKIKIAPEYWQKQANESNVPSEKSRRTSMPHTNSNSNSDMGSTECLEEISFDMSKNQSLEATEREKLTDDDASNELNGLDIYEKNSGIIEMSDNAVDSLSKLNSSFASSGTDESQDRMVLRKKRNVGSMEDLWDESVFLEDATRRTTPVIKISFGAQGEGTVLKIPAKVRSYHDSESDFEDLETHKPKTPTKEARTKAAKKALKKAKKEARRKVNKDKPESPPRPGGSSPYQRRRKRKVKHKKRHKGVREHEMSAVEEEVDVDYPPLLEEDPLKIDDKPKNEESTINNCDIDSMKEKCLKQKLSISLKRLTATAYARCGDTSCSTGSDSSGSNSEFSGADDLPDFPKLDSAHTFLTVESCDTGDGRKMEVGDVVWGKIHGFPWWPGKVLSITIERKEEPQRPQAHVAWYGSSTSSRMPCDQLCPFLETFKTRYNKKKRGPYKEAIRQATCEARKASLDPLAACEARKDTLDPLSACEAHKDSLDPLATCEALKDSLDPLQEVDIVL